MRADATVLVLGLDNLILAIIILTWVVCIIGGALLGYRAGREKMGAVCGFVLGPLGVLLAMTLARLNEPPKWPPDLR